MPKIVINCEFGGFGLSEEAKELLRNKGVKDPDGYIYRDDARLVEVVEELGGVRAGDEYSYLKVVSIPDDVDWEIQSYDGKEAVVERHRIWQ